MKAHSASLINAILLITLSLWAYFVSATPSITALIPVFVGIILIALYKGIKAENKIIAHIAVLLTLLIFFGLIKPFVGAIERADNVGISRVSVMMASTIYSMVYFVKSFIDARKNRVTES